MDNFVNFLLDYYVLILVVLGIIIITIIGFLVDSKQKRRKKDEIKSVNEVRTVEPLPDVNESAEAPIMQAKNQQVPVNVVNGDVANGLNNVCVQSQSVSPSIDSTTTTNVLTKEVNGNQSISLSEQKPHFEPKNVAIPNSVQTSTGYNNVFAVPQPVNAVPINQNIQTLQNKQQEFYSSSQLNNSISNSINSVPQSFVSNNGQPITQNSISNVDINGAFQNSGEQNVLNGAYVSNGTVQNMPVNPTVNQAQSFSGSSNGGINFVTGSTDDNWKL